MAWFRQLILTSGLPVIREQSREAPLSARIRVLSVSCDDLRDEGWLFVSL
jgi:hypothetical protein